MTQLEQVTRDLVGLMLMGIAASAWLWALDVVSDAIDRQEPFVWCPHRDVSRWKVWRHCKMPSSRWLFAIFLAHTVGVCFSYLSLVIMVGDDPLPLWATVLTLTWFVPTVACFVSTSADLVPDEEDLYELAR